MPIPTTRFWILVALGIPLACVGAFIPRFETVLIPYNLGLLALLYVTWRIGVKWDGITVHRKLDHVLSVRVANTVELGVTSDRPTLVRIREQIPYGTKATKQEFQFELEADEEKVARYDVTPYLRGEFEFGKTVIRYPAPWGLAWVQKEVGEEQPARVYPNVKAVREFDLLNQRGHLSLLGMRKSKIRGLGQEFESLREYNDDDYRTIDWKASARRGKLVVRNFETERNQALIVCIDLGRHMLAEVEGVTKLDHTLDAVLMLLRAAELQGDQVGLLLFHDEIVRYVPPKKGRNQITAIVDALYNATAEVVQPDYNAAFAYLAAKWKRRSLVVVFSDAENEDQANELSSSLANVRKHHKLIVVRVADPRMRELKQLPMQDSRELYARAAALWYLGDRRRAASVFALGRIDSLESEPQDLAKSLVTAYIRIKELAQV